MVIPFNRASRDYFNNWESHFIANRLVRAVARALIGGGGCIFIYSGRARLVSFEIKLISKEVSRAEPEYMNIHPLPQLAF